MILYMCSMLFLFGKFFVKRYIQKDTSANMDGVITTKVGHTSLLITNESLFITIHHYLSTRSPEILQARKPGSDHVTRMPR